MSRTESSIKNLITAMIGQVLGIIISFAARIIFLDCLSEDYLGLNGLFTNILTIFSLVELGIGPAMNFSLYKPLAQNDIPKIKSLMALYRKAYIAIGIAILLIGAAFTPFYTVFMNEVPDIPHLTVIYWLFTLNTAVSYFFSYKRALIICDEKRYIATIYRYGFYFLLNAVQIIILLSTGSYIAFLVMQTLFTAAENAAVSFKADRMYPYLKENDAKPVEKETLGEIKKNIGAMLFHKIGGVVVLSTDNIILSKFVSLAAVGIYSNYYLITNALTLVINQVFQSVLAGVGNLNAVSDEKNTDKMVTVFDRMFFLNFWIYGFCSVCLWVLLSPFITLWLGDNMLFDGFTTAVIAINFFIGGMRKTSLTFREATGAFYYDRYKPLAESAINIIASILLAKHFGAAGVFLGTIISTLLTCIWIEPLMLFRHVFHKPMTKHILTMLLYTAVSFAAYLLTSAAANAVTLAGISGFILKMLICAAVPNLIFLICFLRTDNFRYFLGLGKSAFRKIFRR